MTSHGLFPSCPKRVRDRQYQQLRSVLDACLLLTMRCYIVSSSLPVDTTPKTMATLRYKFLNIYHDTLHHQ